MVAASALLEKRGLAAWFWNFRQRCLLAGTSRVMIQGEPEATAHYREEVERAGIEVAIVSTSATGDYYISSSYDGVTEVQAGSYALMDAAYAKLDLGFRNALSVLTMVSSRPTPDRVITDAGLKSVTPEHGMPEIKSSPSWMRC